MHDVYVLNSDGASVPMERTMVVNEDVQLQSILEKNHNLLPGDQMNPEDPRRWLLIKREMPVPNPGSAVDCWRLDFLFADQDAIPTIVEAKRSSDPRLRREVVGQMLDYAANAVVYLPVATIRARFEETCQSPDPGRMIQDTLGSEIDPEDFWLRVKTNLEAGKIRMIFVADVIPAELRRVVEFLNAQMDPAEVLAVEVKQYISGGQKALVPRVLGQTEEAQRKKSSGLRAAKRWSETSFFEALEANSGPEECRVVRRIMDWANGQGLSSNWKDFEGLGELYIFYPTFRKPTYVTCLFTNGSQSIQFPYLKKRSPFTDDSKLSELRARLENIPGVRIDLDDLGYGILPIAALKDTEALNQFLENLSWLIQEIRSCDSAASGK